MAGYTERLQIIRTQFKIRAFRAWQDVVDVLSCRGNAGSLAVYAEGELIEVCLS
jgi:hypothetical protein